MPRPALSDVQIVQARSRILTEAGRIVLADGYAGLSMRVLAKAVGLTAGALYRYFPTKQHVMLAYCAEALDGLAGDLQRIAANEPDPLRALERMMVAFGDFALDDADRFRVVFLDADLSKIDLTETGALDSYRLLYEAVERARDVGVLRPLPGDDIARILWATVHGICVLAVTVPEIDFSDAKALVAAAARNALRGLNPSSEDVDQ